MAPDNLHIGQLIQSVFRSLHKDKDVKWFADCLHCDKSNIYSIFKRNNIDIRLLLKIGEILRYDFFLHLSNQYKDNDSIIKKNKKGITETEQYEFDDQIFINTPDEISVVKTLADIWHNGKNGVPKNVHKSFKFYQIGAQCGDAECQYILGEMLESGVGTKKDRFKAFEWYAKAAQQGHENATKRLER